MKNEAVPARATPPVVLIFLKAPRAGFVKTRLARDLGALRATELYRRLAERQLRNLPAGWPVEIHFTPDDAADEMRRWLGPARTYVAQAPGDLGRKLAAAFERAFAGGATSVVAMGGDCPELDAVCLEEAGRKLTTADVVIGPADDGGYYLLGLRRPAPGLFENIPWGTSTVCGDTISRIVEAGLSCHGLETKPDIDDLAGLRRFLERQPGDSEFASWAEFVAADSP